MDYFRDHFASESSHFAQSHQALQRQRHFYNDDQLALLDSEFASNPFPTRERRRWISKQLNVSDKSVLWWFQNRRRRVRQHQRPGKSLVMKGQQRRSNRQQQQTPYEIQMQQQFDTISPTSFSPQHLNYSSAESSPTAVEAQPASNGSSPVWDLQQCQETFSDVWQNSLQQQQLPEQQCYASMTYSDQYQQSSQAFPQNYDNYSYYSSSNQYPSSWYSTESSSLNYYPNNNYCNYEYSTNNC